MRLNQITHHNVEKISQLKRIWKRSDDSIVCQSKEHFNVCVCGGGGGVQCILRAKRNKLKIDKNLKDVEEIVICLVNEYCHMWGLL